MGDVGSPEPENANVLWNPNKWIPVAVRSRYLKSVTDDRHFCTVSPETPKSSNGKRQAPAQNVEEYRCLRVGCGFTAKTAFELKCHIQREKKLQERLQVT